MIRNYFKIALRNIRRYTVHSMLNISGMAIGMACAFLILLWVQDELSYDKHFKNAGNLYRIIEKQNPAGGEVSMLAPSPSPLANALKEEFPEVVRASRYITTPLTLKKGNENIEENVTVVDTDFLKMFDIKFVQGDINSALNEPRSIILTEEMASKYFGSKDVLGKTMSSLGFDLTITGIVKKLPENTHFTFDKIISADLFVDMGARDINDWNRGRCYNYIELKKGTDSKVVDEKIRHILKKYQENSNSEIFLQNIKSIHLFSSRKYTYDVSGLGDIMYVRIMGLIAIFILLIACINFMNLSTAQSARRSKEIGIRKIAGANRRKIILQFMGESLLLVCTAHLIAMILVELLLPAFNNLTGKHLVIDYQSAGLYGSLILIILFCGILAGSYPALYLSSLKPLNIMKGVTGQNRGNARFRRVLVIFQFSMSVLLIICTLIIKSQFNYLQNKNLGFNKDHIGYFLFPTFPQDPRLESLKKELINLPGIESVTRANNNPFNIEWTSDGFTWRGKKEGSKIAFYIISADADYAKTYKLALESGRFFNSDIATDGTSVVINEAAASILGFNNPLNEIVSCSGTNFTIIGMVKDFHFKPLHYKIEPLIMQTGGSNTFYLRMKAGQIPSTVASIEKIYKSFDPSSGINFHFLDDDFDKLYRTEQRMSKMFGYFSFLAMIIACLGLIGLSSFMTERRTKEIGIRKANGARSHEIFFLLSKEYMIWVIISAVIASPVALYFMNKWLLNFAYRINITWWVFALAGIMVMVLALLTVSWQSYRAAGKNPVEALRYE